MFTIYEPISVIFPVLYNPPEALWQFSSTDVSFYLFVQMTIASNMCEFYVFNITW